MKYLIEEAFLNAILTVKKSYDFYQKMAETISDNRLGIIFREMAVDEAEHMKSFVLLYPGDEFDLLALVNSRAAITASNHLELFTAAQSDLLETKALEISLVEELERFNHYSMLATCIKEPEFRTVFEFAMHDSRKHYEQICDEYLRIVGDDAACLPHIRYITDNNFTAAMPAM